MDRDALKRAIEQRLGRRKLVWAGLRGDDAEPIADLEQFSAALSIIGRHSGRPGVESIAYEDISGVRPDLETWDIDFHLEAEASIEFRRSLLRLLHDDSALLPYRPSRFLSAARFTRAHQCLDLGLFGGHQSAFDHKPWVESSVNEFVPTIGWRYVPDVDQFTVREFVRKHGPVVLRRSRTSGGEGIELIRSPDEVASLWPSSPEGFVSVAPYLDDVVPVNVGATVWHNEVTVHFPSVQLIGISSLVTRQFGYCGNDFEAAKSLDRDVVDAIERSTKLIGGWLRQYGYLGTFGVDFLVKDGVPLFTEINPRFQGSTPASAQLSQQLGQACLLLEHIGAMLKMDATESMPLVTQMHNAPALSHVIVHRLAGDAAMPDVSELARRMRSAGVNARFDVRAPAGVSIDHGATTCRVTVGESVTTTGFDLSHPLGDVVDAWRVSHRGVVDARA